MRVMRLAVVVAISLCLVTTAWGSNWTGGPGDWNLVGNWDAGVPNGTNAYIGNGGTPTIDSLVNNIVELDVAWFSGLNIEDGAGLTAIGDARVAGGGNDFGTVTQTGGVASLLSNLTLGSASGDIAAWTMSVDGDLAVGVDLTVGGSGQGSFQVEDNSTLTVGGRIDIAKNVGGSGVMTVSGGSLGQLAGGGDPAILADLAVGGGGVFRVEGDAAAINVDTYGQASSGALEVEFNNTGISPINVSGNVNVDGILRATVAGVLPDGIYDIIVSDTGTVSGQFSSLIMDHTIFDVRYELNDAGKNAVRVYVNEEAPELPIQGTLPGDSYNKIVSLNFSATHTHVGPQSTPDVFDGAGTVAANNWNNLPLDNADANTYGPAELVDNSGATTESMSVYQDGTDRRHASVGGDPSDPNLNLYASPAPATFRDNSTNLHHSPNTLLTDLQAEFPYGYDVIINTSKWAVSLDGGNKTYVRVYNGAEGTGETKIADLELTIVQDSYNSATGFVEGRNYVKLSNLMYDTLDLRPHADPNNLFDEWNSIQITGVQILGLAPGEAGPVELIVDNLDFPTWEAHGGPSVNTTVADAWRTKPSGALAWWGRTGTYCVWNTPDLPFAEAAEYEVFTWVASEKLSAPGTYYDRDPNAIYTIRDAFGVDHEFVFSQRDARGLGWVSLGTYWFSSDGIDEYVKITSGAQSGQPVTSYDAVRWVWVPPAAQEPPPVPEPAGLGLIGLSLLALKKRRR